MSLDAARKVADAVLYEGYVLYPYRASAQKNRMRWQWGVVEPGAACQVEVLLDGASAAEVCVVARFLQLETRLGDDPWDEGVEQSVKGSLGEVAAAFAGLDEGGDRRREALDVRLSVSSEVLPGPYEVVKVRVRLTNETSWSDADAGVGLSRDERMRRSLAGAHLLLSTPTGRFVSLVDPPEWAAPLVASCAQEGLWPVLVGDDDRVMLAPPIILDEHPRVAPESAGDMFDATEIDEILTLRTMVLTDDEKAEARATDPRAAAVIDRVDAMGAAELARLHGRVRLHPRAGADAQDLFLDEQVAVVEAVLTDVDGETHVAVTLEDDPGADLRRAQGRFFYFRPDEVEPL